MLAVGLFPRQAEAVVSIECEILIEDSDVMFPGQPPIEVAGTNIVEDGTGVDGADPVVAWPGDGAGAATQLTAKPPRPPG